MSITKLVLPTLLDLAAIVDTHKNYLGCYLISMKEQSLFVRAKFNSEDHLYEVPLSGLKFEQVKNELKKSYDIPDDIESFMGAVIGTPESNELMSLFNQSLRSEKIDSLLKPTP